MSCILLDIELADTDVDRELGVSVMGMFKDFHLVFQKSTNAQNKLVGVEESCTEFRGTVDVWITANFSNVLSWDIKVENLARVSEKCNSLGTLFGKVLENLEGQI